MKALVVAALLMALQAFPCSATVYTVNPDGSGDFLRIQDAITAAHSGDEILVYPGTYVENIDFLGKNIRVHSTSGLAATTIDGSQGPPDAGSCAVFRSGEGPGAILEGFTLTRGHGTLNIEYGVYWGGAVFCMGSSCTIRDCRFTDNEADNGAALFGEGGTVEIAGCEFVSNYSRVYGGAVSGEYSSFHLTECLIENNIAQDGDGAVSFGSGINARIDACTFRNNQARAGAGINVGQPDAGCWITNCLFDGNRATGLHGGGLRVHGAQAMIEGCVFWRNSAVVDGGGLIALGGSVTIQGCTFHANNAARNGGNLAIWYGAYAQVSNTIVSSAEAGGGVFLSQATASFACCDTWNNAGGNYLGLPDPTGSNGNISLDPLFCGADTGDFGLRSDSPCRPFYQGGCPLIGAKPVSCEPPPPTAVEASSWGRIKTRFAGEDMHR